MKKLLLFLVMIIFGFTSVVLAEEKKGNDFSITINLTIKDIIFNLSIDEAIALRNLLNDCIGRAVTQGTISSPWGMLESGTLLIPNSTTLDFNTNKMPIR